MESYELSEDYFFMDVNGAREWAITPLGFGTLMDMLPGDEAVLPDEFCEKYAQLHGGKAVPFPKTWTEQYEHISTLFRIKSESTDNDQLYDDRMYRLKATYSLLCRFIVQQYLSDKERTEYFIRALGYEATVLHVTGEQNYRMMRCDSVESLVRFYTTEDIASKCRPMNPLHARIIAWWLLATSKRFEVGNHDVGNRAPKIIWGEIEDLKTVLLSRYFDKLKTGKDIIDVNYFKPSVAMWKAGLYNIDVAYSPFYRWLVETFYVLRGVVNDHAVTYPIHSEFVQWAACTSKQEITSIQRVAILHFLERYFADALLDEHTTNGLPKGFYMDVLNVAKALCMKQTVTASELRSVLDLPR